MYLIELGVQLARWKLASNRVAHDRELTCLSWQRVTTAYRAQV